MNAEDAGGGDTTDRCGAGAGAGAKGIERSRRSPMPPMPEEAAGGFEGAEVLNAEKLLMPTEGLVVRFWTGDDLGLESKKLPPPPNMFEDVEAGDFVLEKASRPEKGEALGAGAALKERLLKASFMPPKADCVGDVCD